MAQYNNNGSKQAIPWLNPLKYNKKCYDILYLTQKNI